jgi:D-glycero-alpha-D-manno-heptose 1-phosphate guanylyltransferase
MIGEAIILAGGFGTRLQSVVKDVPKPMAPVSGKPFLEYMLNYLMAQQFDKIILSVGYRYEVIQEYFKAKYKDLNIVYSIETEPLGTGGAIKQALSFAERPDVAILNGDSFFRIPFAELVRFHTNKKSRLTLALKPMNHVARYGTVSLDAQNKIIRFEEKGTRSDGFINAGVYVVTKDLFQPFSLPDTFSFENDFLQHYHAGYDFYGWPSDAYFIDIGLPEDYDRAQTDFKNF